MKVRYKEVEVTFLEDAKLEVKISEPKPDASKGKPTTANDNTKGGISDCLQFLVDEKVLPASDTWSVDEIRTS